MDGFEGYSVKVLTFGWGAYTAHGVGRRQFLPGGGSTCTTVRADGLPSPDAPADWSRYTGAVAIDMRAAVETERGIRQVISGPILDPALGAWEFSRFGSSRPEVWHWNGAPLEGFDSVGAEVYAALWRKAGARVGRVQGADIVWECGI